ncbi:ribonuclease P protein component [Roseateles sp. BYS180W]|uniref:Ribonuclease P protein component n=1 Tax=Roseateles rivi TaxID=3299028 RepID=A0ABW7FTL1_9BURK
MIGRIQRSADFERVLAKPGCARSAHFAVHHLPQSPSAPRYLSTRSSTAGVDLSTCDAQINPQPVDDCPAPVDEAWLGLVIPKRLARRAVTRNLLKRQIRGLFGSAEAAALPAGLWVVRLRAPFDRKQFPSASSEALAALVRSELRQLLQRLQRPPRSAAAAASPAPTGVV